MSNSLTLSVAESGIATITIDTPNKKVNILTSDLMASLKKHLETVALRSDISALRFVSAKKDCFIAGADIDEIASISTKEDGKTKSLEGQHVFDMIEDLPFPTIALIDGVALGGGLELALACRHRLVTDNPKTLLGLPEVTLGIIPGFGGTQRLPRVADLKAALSMIATGKPVDAKKAVRIGLADKSIDTGSADEACLRFIQEILSQPAKPKRLTMVDKITAKPLLFFAKHQAMKDTHGFYPAPLAAFEVLKKTIFLPPEQGFEQEAEMFSTLVNSEVQKNLTGLFFAKEALKKQVSFDPNTLLDLEAGVVGAGFMGGGIAWLLTKQGFSTRLKDINWQTITKAYETVFKLYQQEIYRKKTTQNNVNLAMHRLSSGTDFTGFGQKTVVFEAVTENMALKKTIFSELEDLVSPQTLLASNTSALSITKMAEDLKNPERLIGFHFFSPVHRMPLVEIIPGEKTSSETIATAFSIAYRLKKMPVLVKDCPGFLVNRILIPYVVEALYMVSEGIDIAMIDATMTAFGMPLGPLALADEVGLDVGFKVATLLEAGYGKRMAVPPIFTHLHEDATLLGKKSGKGFYLYKKNKKTPNTNLQKTASKALLSKLQITDRLILMMVNEAAHCLDEGIVANPSLLDMAMILGTGFPPFRGGLCRYADHLGIKIVAETLHYLESHYGNRFKPAKSLLTLAKKGGRFYEIE